MNLRPQMQLRFRHVEQFKLVKELAATDAKSVNEWILVQIEKHGAEVANGLMKTERVIGASRVSGVRGNIQDDRREKRRTRENGAGAVRRPQHDTSGDAGAVGKGLRSDSGDEAKVWAGPKHAVDCGCTVCKQSKGAK